MKAGINPVLHRHFIVSEQLHTGSASRVGVGVAQDRNRPARAARPTYLSLAKPNHNEHCGLYLATGAGFFCGADPQFHETRWRG